MEENNFILSLESNRPNSSASLMRNQTLLQHTPGIQHSAVQSSRAYARLLTTKHTLALACITALALIISACASDRQADAGKQKQAWLDKTYAPHSTGKQSTLVQLPAATRFRQQILQGHVGNGMTLADAFATLRMQPYGTQPQQAVYWCDATRVNACSTGCIKCEAVLFGQHSIVFLQGSGNQPLVNDVYPKRFEDYRAAVDSSAIHFADQIYQRNIVRGMPAGLVQMIINQQHYQAQYYCGTSGQPDVQSCLGRCTLCKVVITGRSGNRGTQSIFLETHAGQQTVANILSQ